MGAGDVIAVSDVEKRIREAEEYYRHGLYAEARQLYELILAESHELDPDTTTAIADRVRDIEQNLKDMEAIDRQVLSSQDLDRIRGTWSSKGSAADVLQSGDAFVELGMHKEALREFAKLLETDHPADATASRLFESLFALYPATKVAEHLDAMLVSAGLSEAKSLDFQFFLGTEMTNREHPELGLDLFTKIQKKAPDYPGLADQMAKALPEKEYDSRYAFLLAHEIVTEEQLQNALGVSKKSGKSVEAVLIDNFGISRDQVSESLSRFYNVPFQGYDAEMPIPHELTAKLKQSFLQQNTWVPLQWDLDAVHVLIDDPKNLLKTDQIPTLLNARNIKFFVGFKEDIEALIDLFYRETNEGDAFAEEGEDHFEMLPDIDFVEEEEEETDPADSSSESSSQVVKMVDQVLINAYRKGASDIHIEPSPVTKKTSIRYRIDGVCQEVFNVPNQNARAILSRLKVMARLDIAERRLPQDGKIKFKRKGVPPFELRLATLPTAGGFEDAVLRILAESGAMKLDSMGMQEHNLTGLQQIIRQPYGLILVVGPTGSGKTTTLHAALGHINTPGIKIWTAEDPVEITQAGLRQVECNAKIGLDFARVMRAFLRADPDVIMIGEMRDHETASIGIEASLTGHLVLSTLHTNSAPETITRLLDMGLNPLNFSDAFLGVLAQRLVRRVCVKCRKAYHPSREEYDEITAFYNGDMAAVGLSYTEDLKLYQSVGCDACNHTGYKGRMGIHELLMGSPAIKQMIKSEAPTEKLFRQGAAEGMTTLLQDGIQKVFAGHTDIAEIRRVCVS